MFRTTLKSILAHKARLGMTALAVVLGVGLMAGTLVLTDTVGKTFDDLVADIYDGTDAVVRSTEQIDSPFGDALRTPLDESVLATVADVDGVAATEGFVQGQAVVTKPGYEAPSTPGGAAPNLGLSWGDVAELNPWDLVEGERPQAADEVAVDRGTAEEQGIVVGDTVNVATTAAPYEATVTGIVTFGTVDSPGGAAVTLFEPTTAQEVLGKQGSFDEIGVVAAEGVSQDEVTASLNAALPEATEAITGEAKTAEDQQSFRDALSFFNTFLMVFAIVALIVGTFIIVNTFSIIVAQRGHELALLRAIGASRSQVLGSVLLEAVVVGLVASVAGALAGIGIASVLKGLLAAFGIDIPSGPTVITPSSMGTAIAVGLVITVVAAAYPAWRAGKVPPIAAMRDVAVDASGTSLARTIIGAVIALGAVVSLVGGVAGDTTAEAAPLVGLGTFLLLVSLVVLGPIIARPVASLLGWPLARLRGVTGTLARENAARNPKRTSLTAAALMIGVGLVGFITIFAASATASIDKLIDDSVTGDLVVADRNGFGSGFSPSLAQEVQSVDGVAAVSPIRIAPAEVDGSGTFVAGVDVDQMVELSDPDVVEGEAATMGEGDLAISSQVAEAEGWALGDTVPVAFQGGTAELEVAAIFENRALAGDYFVDLTAYEAWVPTQLDFQVFAKLADGADPATTQEAVTAAIADYPTAEVQDLTEFKEAQAAPINQLLNLIYALLALAVVIALIGIANTLALSIHERTRELGLLRAVGMSRAQLRAAIRWESVIMALLGTTLGLVVGLFAGWAMVQALASEGFSTFRLPVTSLVVVVVLGALAGVTAALLPARRAARLDVLDAIASE